MFLVFCSVLFYLHCVKKLRLTQEITSLYRVVRGKFHILTHYNFITLEWGDTGKKFEMAFVLDLLVVKKRWSEKQSSFIVEASNFSGTLVRCKPCISILTHTALLNLSKIYVKLHFKLYA